MPFRMISWCSHKLLTLGGVDRFRIPGDASSGPRDFNNDDDPQTSGTALASVVTESARTFTPPGLAYMDATATTTTDSAVAAIAAGAAGDALLAAAAAGDVLFSFIAGGVRKRRCASLIASVDVASRTITTTLPWAAGGTGVLRLARCRFDAAAVAAAAATAAAVNPRLRVDIEYHLFRASLSDDALVLRVGDFLTALCRAIKVGAPSCELAHYHPSLCEVVDLYVGFAQPSQNAALVAAMRRDNEVFARSGCMTAADVLIPDLYPVYDATELAQFNLTELAAWRLEAEFTLAECRRLVPTQTIMPAVRTQYFAFSGSVNLPIPQAVWQGMVAWLHESCPGAHIWGQTNFIGGTEFPANYAQDLAKRSPSWVADLATLKTGRW